MQKTIFLETERLRNLHSGLGQFCWHLGQALCQQADESLRFTFFVPSQHRGIFGQNIDYQTVSPIYKFFPLPQKKDIWHILHQDSAYWPSRFSTHRPKVILTIHDLNFLERSDYSQAKKQQKLAILQHRIDRADVLTTISDYTASVIKTHLQTDHKPLHVIHNGNSLVAIDLSNFSTPDELKSIRANQFLFSIGVVHPKKNFHVLLPLLQQNPDLQLVIAGNTANPYSQKIVEIAQKLGVANQLMLLGNVSDEVKYWLFQHCLAFVFPSLSEGFGLPVVEAMSIGKPVFLSNLTSLPEVGGDAAYYWQNTDPTHLQAVFEQGMTDYQANATKKEAIQRQARRFTWQKAAEKYILLYKNMN